MTDETPPYGPKMLALANDRQRAFVAALYDDQAPLKGDGLLIYAAREAGYGDAEGTSTNKALSVIANRLVQDSRVQAAIAEFSHSTLRAISPEAIAALKNVIRDPKHRDHMRAIAAIADRVDPIEQTHVHKIEDSRPTPEMTQAVLDKIEELMRRVGLAPKAPIVIDGACQAVGEGRA
jgi:hypothetical protein